MDSHFISESIFFPKANRSPLVTLLGFVLIYCGGYFLAHELKTVHLLFSGFILFLFFLHSQTRMFALLAIPVIFKNVIFDFTRYIPFQFMTPVHILGPYQIEKDWFGIFQAGQRLIPNEWLLQHLNPFLDILTGICYFLNEPIAIVMIVLLWKKKSANIAFVYACSFLIMNLMAFVTQIFFPVAPPWYVMKYGFEQPLHPIPGDPAGLIRFDQVVGFPVSKTFYGMSPIVFGAIPSMHAGFAMLEFLFSFQLGRVWSIISGLFFLGVCFSAVYLQHHYIIDLLAGVLFALGTTLLTQTLAYIPLTHLYQSLFHFFIGRSSSHAKK
ncbi:MAG: phosphatase PAP2 family protein [Deltaproteobacteria bacterium]|nr:phosphatase PAP2 family protein [Deltaproteobacteria bacterium]